VADLSTCEGHHYGFELKNIFGIELKEGRPAEVGSYQRGAPASCTDYLPELFELDASLHYHYYLDGYWQNELYLARVKEELFASLVFPELDETESLNRRLMHVIKETNSVSIHLREGDYRLAGFPLSSEKYYQAAMAYVAEKTGETPQFFIFSDNIAYAQDVIGKKTNALFISHNQGKKSFRDMQLMSLCKHNIIDNSTFSFWGAYLNKNPAKLVTAPKTLLGTQQQHLICEGWVLFDN
jgi:hypothetical protein